MERIENDKTPKKLKREKPGNFIKAEDRPLNLKEGMQMTPLQSLNGAKM